MSGRTIVVRTPDGDCDTYITYPDSGGPFPAVLVFMDAPGLRPALQAISNTSKS